MGKRRWLLWVLLGTFAWLVISRLDELEELLLTLRQGIWLWVLVAAVTQVGYYVAQAALHQATFKVVGVRSRVRDLIPVVLGSLFINVVAPAGGTAAVALYVDDAVQRGESGARTAAGTILAVTAMYVTLTVILIASLVYMYAQVRLTIVELLAAGILLGITVTLAVLLFLGYRQPRGLRRLLERVEAAINGLAARLNRRPFLAEEWAARMAAEFTEGATVIGERPHRLWGTLGWALLSHLTHVATLYALFMAFRRPDVPIGALVAGYAIGMLFVVVSPTPMGVGFVENLMPGVFIAVGVPNAVATLTVLAYRGLAFWLPLLIGFFLLQRLKSLGAEERTLTQVWSVRIVAVLTMLMGLINAFAAVPPSLSFDIDLEIPGVSEELAEELAEDLATVVQYSPLEVQQGGQLTAAVSGLALLLLGFALWRRKRAAWVMTLLVLGAAVAGRLWQRDWVVAGLGLALGGWLFLLRPHFHARSDRPSVRQAIQLLLAAWVFILAYGVFGFYWLTSLSQQPFSVREALAQTFTMMTRFYNPLLIDVGEATQIFGFAIYLLSGLTYAYVFFLLVRPVLQRQPATPAQRSQAAAVVAEHGGTTLALQALWRGQHFFFSAGGSVIAYELHGRTAIALGDPVGPAGDVEATMAAFQRFCHRNDWMPAFYQVRPEHLDAYRKQGLHVIAIGREGCIDLQEINWQEERYERLQETVTALVEKGHQAALISPPLDDELLDDLHQISDEWLTLMNVERKRVWLGAFDREYARRRLCLLTYNAEGTISAFATIIAAPGGIVAGIDQLQHRSQIEPGTIALLFFTLVDWARGAGYRELSYGTIPLDEDSLSSGSPVLNALYQDVSHYTLRDTHDVELQFAPQWSMRYLAYSGTMSLPVVWGALLRGEGFTAGLVWTLLKRRLGL